MRYPLEMTAEEIMEFEQEYNRHLDLLDKNTFAEINAELQCLAEE